jgi:hypothetical protein
MKLGKKIIALALFGMAVSGFAAGEKCGYGKIKTISSNNPEYFGFSIDHPHTSFKLVLKTKQGLQNFVFRNTTPEQAGNRNYSTALLAFQNDMDVEVWCNVANNGQNAWSITLSK